jgi:hypothetical protein
MKSKEADLEFEEGIGRELRNLLSVDPPPGFVARVRVRVGREPERVLWNSRWTLVAAGLVASIFAALLVFLPRGTITPRRATTDLAATSSIPASASPAVESLPVQAREPHRRVSKTAKAEQQLLTAADETSALHRLLNREVGELPRPFEPEVEEFQTREIDVVPLPAPPPITVEPIELPQPAVE